MRSSKGVSLCENYYLSVNIPEIFEISGIYIVNFDFSHSLSPSDIHTHNVLAMSLLNYCNFSSSSLASFRY